MAKKTIRAKAKERNGLVDVKLLMKHPMETGLRKDKDGNKIPEHFIQTVKATHNGNTVFDVQFNTAVSKDPYLAFSFAGAKGDTMTVAWADNTGDTDSADIKIK